MSSLTCRFCVHRNPEGSKFCNECGSPLNLVPCPQCEAVNSAADEHCFSCGAPLPAATPTADERDEREPALEVAAHAEPSGFADASIPVALADRLVHPEPALESLAPQAMAYAHAEPSQGVDTARTEAPVEIPMAAQAPAARSLEWKPNRLRGFLLVIALVAIAAGLTWTSLMPAPAIAPERSTEAPATAPPPASAPAAPSSAPANVEAPVAPPAAPAPSTASQPETASPPQTPPEPSGAPPVAADTASPATEPEAPASEAAAPPSGETSEPPRSEKTSPPVRPRSVAKSETRASEARRHAAPDRSREQAERDALATQRLIARELGIAPRGQAPAARRP